MASVDEEVLVHAHALNSATQQRNKNKVTRTSPLTPSNRIVFLVPNFSACRTTHNLRRTRCSYEFVDENTMIESNQFYLIPELNVENRGRISMIFRQYKICDSFEWLMLC